MVLYFIGLGLADERDITVKGLEAVKKSTRVYLEAYTSVLLVPKEQLEEFYGRSVIVADREMVEMEADKILEGALEDDVSFLVVGDPYGATTHTDLELRARAEGITVKTIHNASIMNAVGAAGLQLYRYGETISIVFFTGMAPCCGGGWLKGETWRPDSFYDRIVANKKLGLHTLCLLDIKVKEPSLEALCRGKKIYEPPRFMTVNTAVEQLLEIEAARGEGACTPESQAVGVARIGADSQLIVAGTLAELVSVDFGAPLHSLILAGDMHHVELEAWQRHRLANEACI